MRPACSKGHAGRQRRTVRRAQRRRARPRPRPSALLAGVVLALVVGSAGCSGGQEQEAELGPGVLRIGHVGRLDGARTRDERIARGARLAVAEINALGGIDGVVRLELARIDESTGGAGASGGAIAAMIAPCDSGAQGLVSRRAHLRRALLVAPCDLAPALRSRARDIVPIAARSGAQAGKLADHLAGSEHRRLWIAAGESSRFSASFARESERLGLTIVARTEPRLPARVPAADALVVDAGPGAVRELVRGLRRRGAAMPVFGTSRLDTTALLAPAEPALEGLSFVTFGYPEPGSELDELYERHRAAFGRSPEGSDVGLGYAAVRAIEAAVNVFESTEPARMREAFEELEVGSPLGVLEYTPDQVAVDVVLVTVRNGRFELLERDRVTEPVVR